MLRGEMSYVDDVVLCHTLPVFMGLGWCPIVSWDFAGAELCWIKRIETLQVDGDGVKGRPRKRWREVLREDMREKGLCREDAWDR